MENSNFYDDGKYVYLNAPYAEAYIYADLFDDPDKSPTNSSVAYVIGESVVAMGIMYFRTYKTEQELLDRSGKVNTMKYPNLIEMKPSVITDKSDIEINGVTDKYIVLKFEKGDIIMDLQPAQSIRNVEKFVNMVLSGRIPKSLKYEDIYHAWKKNALINDFKIPVPDVVLQVLISEMCRDPKNLIDQFRKLAGTGKNINPYGYDMLNMNAVTAYSSIMSALSFERYAEKLTTSINMTKDGTPQKVSPLEKVLMM